jgi:hypothetical protein
MEKMINQKLLKSDGSGLLIPVAETANVYSRSQKIDHAKTFCLSVMAVVESGTPDVDLYLEQTHIDPASVASSEGIAASAGNGWAQAVGASKIADIVAANTWYRFTITPLAVPYLRILCDGQGANPASTQLHMVLTAMEDLSA